jgi:tRNA(fMet)-specific endonuclease VapC
MKLMLDTTICITIIKQKPPEVLARFHRHDVGDIALSAITAAELQYGVYKSQQPQRNQAALDQFLLPLVVADFDHSAAAAYGQIRAALERQGRPLGPLDMLIAAHALSRKLVLVTNNLGEFARVPGLAVEKWASP